MRCSETVLGGAAFAVVAMLGARYVAFAARLRSRPPAPTAVKIIVFGAGDAGTQLIHRLAAQSGAAYRPVAILDDDPAKRRLRIDGVPVLGGRGQMAEVAASTGAKVLVIAIAGRSGRVIHDLTEEAERCGLVPKVIPSVKELLTGGARIEGVRDPRISDLLGRPAAATDVASVREHIAGKRVLVTGAGGSIGAELCRQLHRLGPAELIMLDRDESALHASPARAERAGPARFRGDRAGRHPGPAPGQGGLREVPAGHRVPRRGAQAPAAAGELPG